MLHVPRTTRPGFTLGFTLAEMLIVITIIVVLMGLLFPAISLVKKEMKKAQTRSTLGSIASALEKYRNVNAAYVDACITPPDPVDVFFLFRNGTQFKEVEKITAAEWDTINLALVSRLETVDGADLKTLNGLLVDSWGKTLRYRPAKYHPFLPAAANPTAKKIDTDDPPKGIADTFALWSTGSDTIDQFGEAGSNDLTSWAR